MKVALAHRFCIAMAVFGATASAFSQITINPSVKNGDKIAGAVQIRVTVQSKNSVNQVEFYVNGELRATDTSTPYTYTLDTLPEKEGPLTLDIGAYTSKGDSKKIKLKLIVDNGTDKGAKYHVDNANKFLNVGKWDDAIQAARVALKADENSADAKLAMARAYYGKKVFDKAQTWAEDALLARESEDITELLAGIHAERAFSIISTTGERGDALTEIEKALKAAIVQRQATMAMRVKALGPVTDANRLAHVDLMLDKHDYSAARRLLLEKWSEGSPDIAIGNRLVYATMRSGRMAEAYRLIQLMKRKETMDATTYALLAAGHAYFRHFDEATAAIKDGGFDDPDSSALITASAYTALLRGDKGAAGSQVTRLVSQNYVNSAAYYYLQTLMWFTGMYTESRDYFRKAVVRDPLFYDAYVERAYQALTVAANPSAGLDKDKEVLLKQAAAFFNLALAVKPDSPEALNGSALVLLYQKKGGEALSLAKAAVSAGPEYPWAHYTLAAALNATGDFRGSIKEVDAGGKLDPVVLQGRGAPSSDEAWQYTYRYARLPVLLMPRS